MELTQIRTPMKAENLRKLFELDESFIGTTEYMGLAYFWGYEYKFTLRDCTIKNRIKIHDAWLKAGLPLNGASNLHKAILDKITKNDPNLKKEIGIKHENHSKRKENTKGYANWFTK